MLLERRSIAFAATGLLLTLADGSFLRAADPYLVKDINVTMDPGSQTNTNGSYPRRRLTPIGDRFVFSADDGVHGEELWITDGTDKGTALLKDINPGSKSFFDCLLIGASPRCEFPGISVGLTPLGDPECVNDFETAFLRIY